MLCLSIGKKGLIMYAKRKVLVLGASGGIGGEVARRMLGAGWEVVAMSRSSPVSQGIGDGISWMQGDAMHAGDVAAAARGCAVIVHAVNPPGYRGWRDLVLPMLDNTVAAAARQAALVVLPGTVYNYGPEDFPLVTEESAQRPQTRKGAIRVEMENRLRAYAGRGGRALIVRAGDFFGPHAGNSWFSQALVKPGRAVTRISNPCTPGIGHQWSYLPDVAETMLALIERNGMMDPFSSFHMAGHWDETGMQMAQAIQRTVLRIQGTAPGISAFPWWLLRLAAPFNATLSELREMRYLWQQPVRMTNRKLIGLLGKEPHTPLDDAVEATLAGLGCLGPASAVTA